MYICTCMWVRCKQIWVGQKGWKRQELVPRISTQLWSNAKNAYMPISNQQPHTMQYVAISLLDMWWWFLTKFRGWGKCERDKQGSCRGSIGGWKERGVTRGGCGCGCCAWGFTLHLPARKLLCVSIYYYIPLFAFFFWKDLYLTSTPFPARRCSACNLCLHMCVLYT